MVGRVSTAGAGAPAFPLNTALPVDSSVRGSIKITRGPFAPDGVNTLSQLHRILLYI